MKLLSIISIVLLSLLSTNTYCQELKSSNRTLITQSVDISKYRNKKFRVSGMTRSKFTGNKSHYIIYYILTKESGNPEYSSNASEEMKPSEEWVKTNLEGIIHSQGKELTIGIFCMNNGSFFFDDIKLEIEDENEKWQPLTLNNPSFEDETQDEQLIWGDDKTSKIKQFKTKRTTENPFHGKYSLLVEGKNIIGQNRDTGKFVEVNNVKLYYEIYGEGEPLMLLHGAGQSISAFIKQVDFFAKDYKVIALDSRGRGNSTDTQDELTYINQAKDVSLFMDALNLKSASIIGWSDGGIIGLILAMQEPEKVNKLVAFGANINADGLFDERLEYHKKNLKKYKEEENYDPKSINIKILKQLINYPKLEFSDLKTITAPTLIMAGDHDVIKDIHTVKIYQAISNAYLAIFPGETHWMPQANSELFNETVSKFLSKKYKNPRRY